MYCFLEMNHSDFFQSCSQTVVVPVHLPVLGVLSRCGQTELCCPQHTPRYTKPCTVQTPKGTLQTNQTPFNNDIRNQFVNTVDCNELKRLLSVNNNLILVSYLTMSPVMWGSKLSKSSE